MGCGTSINQNDVKAPTSTHTQPDIKISEQTDSQNKIVTQHKFATLKQSKTQKSIHISENINELQTAIKQQQPVNKITNVRLYMFGQSKQERKIIQFQALPTPHIEILLSRSHNLPPVKYQPPQIILQQSQQLTSSHLYMSSSHPPYNYMFATFIKQNTIFLCGGVNYGFQYVSNQAFLYSIKDQQANMSSPRKAQKPNIATAFKNKRRIGNNLMGNKFERLSLMKMKRYSHMGVYLKAGKLGYIYILGGRTQGDQTLTHCQKYSIQQNKWSQIAPMNAPRSTGFSIIVNKKIYVLGGYTRQGKRSKKIERYNPTFDSWEVLNIKLHKGIQTGIIFPCPSPNQILIVGGNVQQGAIKTVLRINFQNQTYIWDSDLKRQRLLQKGIALLQENSAYVLGGDFEDTIQKYSYKDKTWKLVTGLTYSQCVSPQQINAFTLAQQTVQLIFNAETNANSSINKSLKQKQNENTLSGQYKYVFGTDDYPSIYEINTSKWVLKKKNVPMTLRLRCFMTVAKIKEGKIFIAGGIDCYFQNPSRAAYIYYPGTNKAIQIAKMKQKKYAFSACSYKNFIYIFGGQDGKQGKVLGSAQKYDINEDKWIDLSQMPRQRTYSKAILSPNNKILLFGGTDCLYQTIFQVDIFDPQTDKFSTVSTIFPLACQIKFIQFTGETIIEKKKKSSEEQFQFLDQSKTAFDLKIESQIAQKKQKVQQIVKYQKIDKKLEEGEYVQESAFPFIAFGYNSYRKQDQAYILSLTSNQPYGLTFNQKSHKLYPYLLAFSTNQSPTKQSENKPNQSQGYYLISNKGVFKWQKQTKQVNSQIVINQMHMLQMPLQKFCII